MGTVMNHLAVPIAVVLLVHATTSSGVPLRFEFEQRHMGTLARVVVYTRDPETARGLADGAFARIAELDARLSDYRDDSEVMRLCAKAGGPPVGVSGDLLRVLDASLRFARQTDGAFDVTVGPVSRVWRRARAASALPDPQEVAAAQRLVGYQNIELSLERRTVRLKTR